MVTARKVTKGKRRTARSKQSKTKTTFSLPGPDELNEPPENFLEHCILIFGESAIGKTSLVAQIDGCVVLQFDPKRKNLRIRQVEMEYKTVDELNKERPDYTPHQKLIEYLSVAYDDPTVKAVAIDNLSKCYYNTMNHVCFERGCSHPQDAGDFGNTWKAVEDEFTSLLNAFRTSEKGLILITHGHMKDVTPPHGDPYDRWEPDLPKQAFGYVKENCDFVFNYHMHEGKRTIMVRSDEDVFTKCTVDEHFMSPTGNPVKLIDAGPTPATAWKAIQDSYHNKVKDVNEREENKRKTRRRKRS